MKYAVEFTETSIAVRMIEATCWHEALMKGIKMHDHGEITFTAPPRSDVEVIGYPYQITEVWTLEDVASVIKEQGYTFTPALTDEEEREILLDAKARIDEAHGLCYQLLDESIHRLYESRITATS